MSNILIIKHGSLGDIAQASGAIQDICENHLDDNIYILTTKPYLDLLKKFPNIKDVILDKRLSRFNIFYLYILMKNIKKFYFQKLKIIFGLVQLHLYQKILKKRNLIKYLY